MRFACATTSQRKSDEEFQGKRLTAVVEALVCPGPITIVVCVKDVTEFARYRISNVYIYFNYILLAYAKPDSGITAWHILLHNAFKSGVILYMALVS